MSGDKVVKPVWVSGAELVEPEEPDRGDTIQVRVDFKEPGLDAGDGEEWSHALVHGRASQADNLKITAMVSPMSKAPPKKLAGTWDIVLARERDELPWQLVVMRRRS